MTEPNENVESQPSEDPKAEPVVISLSDMFYSNESVVLDNADNFGHRLPWEKDLPAASTAASPYDGRFEVLQKASTQVIDDTFEYGGLSNLIDQVVEPKYNMLQLLNLNDISVVRSKCIEALASYSVGLGYHIVKVDPHAETVDTDKIGSLIRKQLEKWAARDEKTFTELMYAVKYDEETTGNAFIEVSRNRKGEIDGLYHVASHTVRLRRDRTGYLQQRGTTKVPFYRFGDKVTLYDDNTIEYIENRDPKINELIHIRRDTSHSSYYGQPRDVSAIVTIAGDELARNHNIKFFSFSGTPELALVFEVNNPVMPTIAGDQPVKVSIPESVKRQILEHFRRNLSSKFFEPGMFFLPNGVSLKIEKLSAPPRDAGWTKYREANRDEVRMAWRTPPIIIGDSSSGYATAAIEKSVYQEGVVEPEQERYEARIMALLWPELVMITDENVPFRIDADGSQATPVKVKPEDSSGVDSDMWILKFQTMDLTDKATMAANHQVYGGLKAITINEIRQDLKKKPLEDGDVPPESPTGDATTIKGRQGREGGGRGPNGTVTSPMPRRTTQTVAQTPANLTSVGTPGYSPENTAEAKVARAPEEDTLLKSTIEEIEEARDHEDVDALKEIKERLEADPELQAEIEQEYLDGLDEAFSGFMNQVVNPKSKNQD